MGDPRYSLRVDEPRSFSKLWFAIALFVFVAAELFLGGYVAKVFQGRHVSHMLSIRVELMLSLVSYAIGGFVIGVVSPGLRMYEPAFAAAASAVFTFMIAWFTPLHFYTADPTKMMIAGVLAFFIALAGARLGERLMGNYKDPE